MPTNAQTTAQLHLSHTLESNAQNFPSEALTVCELRTSRYSSWIQKRQRNQKSNCQHPLDHRKSKRVPEKHLFLLYWLYQKPFCVDHSKLWKILKEMGIPDHLTCLLRNLCAGQEAIVSTSHGTTECFQIGKGVHQVCILSPCLFNFYAGCIMWNDGLDESQAGITTVEEISRISDIQMIPLQWWKVKST